MPSVAYGQFSDSVHYYAAATSTGTINKTGNSSSYILNNGIKLGIKRKDIALNSTNSWAFGEQKKLLTNNDFNSTLFVNIYKAPPHFYYWGLANYLAAYSLKINNQYQAGAGIAYNIIDKKKTYINVSEGVLYENSDVLLKDTVREIYNTFRNSLRLSFGVEVKGLITISSVSYYQNSLSSSTDYILKSNINLGVKLNKWLNLTTSYTYNRFNRTQKETTLFIYGLTLERYF